MRRLAAMAVAAAALAFPASSAAAPQVIYLVNATTSIADARVADLVPALQAAVSDDFAPNWNEDARIVFDGGSTPPPGSWPVYLDENADVPFALGYHGVDENGVPFAKAFAADSLADGVPFTLVLTHEMFELLADPYVSRAEWNGRRRIYLLEVADPVADAAYGYYRVDAAGRPFLVSDFVTEQWFSLFGFAPFDFTGHVTRPGQLLPGAYVNVWRHGFWTELDGAAARRARLRAV